MNSICKKCEHNNVAENWKKLGIGVMKFLGWTALAVIVIVLAIAIEDYRHDRSYYRRWY